MNDYAIGDVVYLRVRDEPVRGMVVRLTYFPGGFLYGVTWGNGNDTFHYGIELSTQYVPDYAKDDR
jgi:hypothetical protein